MNEWMNTLMYINITRFGYIQWHTALQTTVGLHEQTRGQNVLKILNRGVKSLNYTTSPGSKFTISWVGWRCELGGATPNPPSNLTLWLCEICEWLKWKKSRICKTVLFQVLPFPGDVMEKSIEGGYWMMPERLSTCRDVARKKSGCGLDLGVPLMLG